MKRLYRDKSNEMIGGVCSGIAEYLDVDVTIIRLLFVLFTFMGGGGLWIYLVLWFIMPEKPVVLRETVEMKEQPADVEKQQEDNTATVVVAAEEIAPAKKPAAKSAKAADKSAAKSKAAAAKKTPASPKPKVAAKTDEDDK
jgi:phage shock protein C